MYKTVLFLLALIPLLGYRYFRRHKNQGSDIRYAHSFYIENVKKSLRLKLLHFPFVLRILAMIFLILALARPQGAMQEIIIDTEGIDIVIAIDISSSMLAEDFTPNRMHVAKETALEFIAMRPNDRIGVTLFSGESFTLSPVTTDHSSLASLISSVQSGMVVDGTAIGNGIATAVSRLRESESVSKVIILLTDGINNAGMIDPLTAAEMASVLGIRIYSIGIGTKGPVPFPVETPFGIRRQMVEMPIDDELLTRIAQSTGGQYFRAGSIEMLRQIYLEIDRLERTRTEVAKTAGRKELFLPFVVMALLLLTIEFLLRNTWLKTNP